MKDIIILSGSLVLISDAHYPIQKIEENTRFIVEMNIIKGDKPVPCPAPSQYLISEACYRATVENGMRVVHITAREPKSTNDRKRLCEWGHELAHGVYGDFHGSKPTGC